MEDSRFADAPETPAPIFAYRALKGFFFGSPNEDDDVPAKAHRIGGDENKENVPPAKSLGTPKPHSPFLANEEPTKSTRKRALPHDVVSSPMKSILRPSGVATPRALQLQKGNVGVTFKDIGKNSSPEGRPKLLCEGPDREILAKRVKPNPPTQERRDIVGTNDMGGPRRIDPPSAAVRLSTEVHTATGTTSAASATIPDVPFDIEAYKRSTEKEMKKLVRYGQKMREYARKQDEENVKLRQLLEECRRENERLKKAEGQRSQNRALFDSSKTTGGLSNLEIPHRFAVVTASRITQPETVNNTGGERDEMSRAIHETSKRLKGDTRTATSPIFKRLSPTGKYEPQHPPETQTFGVRHSSARLPPDRIAAARERIRLKAEKRKASEMSSVDWVGL